MEWIKRAWRGEARLWLVFWIYGVVFGIVFALARLAVFAVIGKSIAIPFIVIHSIYWIWLAVSQWRCAFNTEWKIWGYVVRILTLMGIVSYVAMLAFGGSALSLSGNNNITTQIVKCEKDQNEYLAKGGSDLKEYEGKCLDAITLTSKPRSFNNILEAAIINTQKDKIACEQTMVDYARQNGANPQQYIDENKDYLNKCIQAAAHKRIQEASQHKNP